MIWLIIIIILSWIIIYGISVPHKSTSRINMLLKHVFTRNLNKGCLKKKVLVLNLDNDVMKKLIQIKRKSSHESVKRKGADCFVPSTSIAKEREVLIQRLEGFLCVEGRQ